MPTALPAVRVGRTSLQVSLLGLGTAPIGNVPSITESQAIDIVHTSLNAGIRFLDTAPYYGNGRAERYLGAALAGVPRSNYVLSTKVGRLITPEGKAVFDFSREGIVRSFEESLQRLRLDAIDILLIHDPDEYYQEALDNAFPVLADLRDRGVVKAIGAGMNQWQMLAEFARHADFDCFLLAGRYTLLEQGALDTLLPLCQQKGISIFAGGVYNSGILARGAQPGAQYNYADAPPAILERARRLEEVCARYHIPLYVAAIQFPLAHPAITALLVGAESTAEVETNLQALATPIPPQLWDDLRKEGLLHEQAPVPLRPFL